MNKAKIRELALANGFKLKEQPDGTMELNPYVYEFAAALMAEHSAVLEEAMESIVEYWNKDRNDEAMHDACWHNVNTAAEALEKFRSERIRQGGTK
jgi:hypothetical protein